MVVFGGATLIRKNDTWLLQLEALTWAQLRPSGPPPARKGHAAACHGDLMAIHGGYAMGFAFDLWLLDLKEPSAWVQLEQQGPGKVAWPSCACRGQEMIVFGGAFASVSCQRVWGSRHYAWGGSVFCYANITAKYRANNYR